MLKRELITEVAEASGHNETVVRQVFEAITSSVLTSLAGGASVMLLGLGKLSVVHRGPKKARHMKTGEVVIVPPRKVAKLRPSDATHAAINPGQVGA